MCGVTGFEWGPCAALLILGGRGMCDELVIGAIGAFEQLEYDKNKHVFTHPEIIGSCWKSNGILKPHMKSEARLETRCSFFFLRIMLNVYREF